MSGFAQYGNFWNYYEFNKVDERLRFLDEEQVAAIFHQKTDHDNINIMDIGCNEGNLTLAVEQILHCSLPSKTIHFLAIDIDHELIKRANNKKTETNSQIQFFSDDVVKSNIPNEFLQSHGAGKK
jgi:tRNA1(Val) A37 N6-methylase TrmN6